MIERTEFRQFASSLLLRAKCMQVVSNDYRVIPWADVAFQLDMDPANLSKIVTGVTDCRVSTFLAILRCLGCTVSIDRYEDVKK